MALSQQNNKMNTLSFLLAYLCEHFKNLKYHVIPTQIKFTENHKIASSTILYYGFFTVDTTVQNLHLNSVFLCNKNNPVFFTNLEQDVVIENLQFIGWKISFTTPFITVPSLYEALINSFTIIPLELIYTTNQTSLLWYSNDNINFAYIDYVYPNSNNYSIETGGYFKLSNVEKSIFSNTINVASK